MPSAAPVALTLAPTGRLPAPATKVAEDLLARLDHALPGRMERFYLVGSACMGAFRLGRSDVDFVAIVDRRLARAELARLGALHLGRWTSALVRHVAIQRRWPLVCNRFYREAPTWRVRRSR